MRLTDTDAAPPEDERFVTAGVDIGMRSVKVALLAHAGATGEPRVLASEIVTVPRQPDVRDAQNAVREGWSRTLRRAGLVPADIALVASTGQAHALARVGSFYRGLSLVVGVRFLFPRAIAVVDVGARHIRCTRLETSSCRRGYATTSKGETYEGVAARTSKLMKLLSLDGPTAITGAMAIDRSFLGILAQRLTSDRLEAVLLISPNAVFTAAYGAALLAARRFLRAPSSRRRGADSPVRSPWSPTCSILN